MKINSNQIIGRLSARIANLESQLAHSQALNDAYAKKIQELNDEIKEREEEALDRQVEQNLQAE